MFDSLSKELTDAQYLRAQKIMQQNLAHHRDWIVLNTSMATLAKWAKKDENLRKWMLPHLERLALDERKSVSGRSQKLLKQLN